AHRQDDVGPAGKRLLPRAAHRERVVLRQRPLRGPARVDGEGKRRGERPQLGCRVGPEHAVPGDDERAFGPGEGVHGPVDRRGVGGGPQRPGRIEARPGPLPGGVVLVVEDVRRDLDQRWARRPSGRLAERRADVEADRRPVERALERRTRALAAGQLPHKHAQSVLIRSKQPIIIFLLDFIILPFYFVFYYV